MKLGIFAAISTILVSVFAISFYVFDYSLTASGSESVKAWLKGEETAVAQGNLLTSVTKTQKILLSSEFIKGIAVYDISSTEERILIEFGKKPARTLEIGEGMSFKIVEAGFLSKEIFVVFPQKPDLLIGFAIQSDKLEALFWITNGIFVLLIALFSSVLLLMKRQEQAVVARYAKRAGTVAHDLAQPLLALNALSLEMDDSGKSQTLRAVIQRITSIVDDLGMGNKRSGDLATSHAATFENRIQGLIEEKRSLIGGRAIKIKLHINDEISAISTVEAQFLRILSNLLDNSMEAISEQGLITVSFAKTTDGLRMMVEDTGKGIPADILPRIGERGFSHDKENGNGLGVSSAREFVEGRGGWLEIHSVPGVGTAVSLQFPSAAEKKRTIYLTPEMTLAVLDDDPLCLGAMKRRFHALGIPNKVMYFSNHEEFESFLSVTNSDELFLFSDFDMKAEKNGLEVIRNNNLANQSVLITAMAGESRVRREAERLGVPVFDKAELDSLNIEMVG